MQVVPFKVFVPNDKVEQATNAIRTAQQQAVAQGRLSDADTLIGIHQGDTETEIQTQIIAEDYEKVTHQLKEISSLIRVLENIFEGLKRLGNEVEGAAKAVGNGVEDAAKVVGNAAEDVGRGIANVARKLWPF